MSKPEFKAIWLQWKDDDCDGEELEEITWCQDCINIEDVKYVRADLVAERERELGEVVSDMRELAEREEGQWRHFYERLNPLAFPALAKHKAEKDDE